MRKRITALEAQRDEYRARCVELEQRVESEQSLRYRQTLNDGDRVVSSNGAVADAASGAEKSLGVVHDYLRSRPEACQQYLNQLESSIAETSAAIVTSERSIVDGSTTAAQKRSKHVHLEVNFGCVRRQTFITIYIANKRQF